MIYASEILDLTTAAAPRADMVGSDRDFPKPARDVENIFGQAEARQGFAKAAHQCLADLERHAKVRRTWREVRMVEIIDRKSVV